eukprot:Gb_22948 [translate_table: standard]
MKKEILDNLCLPFEHKCKGRGNKIPDEHLIIVQGSRIRGNACSNSPNWTSTIIYDSTSKKFPCLFLKRRFLLWD